MPPEDDAGGPAAPDSLGRFLLRRKLGAGGMGSVFEAWDPAMERTVAVKLLHERLNGTAEHRERFLKEAKLTGRLEHPNVVPVHELGAEPDGRVFFVMKRISGRSLEQILRQLRAGAESRDDWGRHRLLSIFIQVCKGVAYAHEQGVLHRDIKPDNIMVGPFGEVLVLDWGVSELLDTLRSGSGSLLAGTAGFLAPELCAEAGSPSVRSDVWSLGAVLFSLLTLRPPYRGQDALSTMFQVAHGPRPDPREGLEDDEPRIPDELAEICLRAMAREPSERTPSALALASEIEDFLEGSKRRRKAAAFLERAAGLWERHEELGRERRAAAARVRELAAAVEPWRPLDEKRELLELRRRTSEIGPERSRVFGDLVSACETALSYDPDSAPARARLAEAYWARFMDAEERNDAEDAAFWAERVLAYDDGHLAELMHAGGTLSLDAAPSAARVGLRAIRREGLIWEEGDEQDLGALPIAGLELPSGSYLLIIRGRNDELVRYPVHLTRGSHWEAGAVPLFDSGTIGEGFVYVPAAPAVLGGDPDARNSGERRRAHVPAYFIQRFPVTMAEYAEFLTELHAVDPDRAWERVPRSGGEGSQYFERPGSDGRYRVPEVDRDGDPWDPRWAVVGVSRDDALAYAAWLSERHGRAYDLPTEDEWEKAARGVDGRRYPWGDGFDASLCKTRDSRADGAVPEPVGSFPGDLSIYGVRDLAGNVREWCAERSFDGDPALVPVRGGAWILDGERCRCASRNGDKPNITVMYRGFRLVHRP